MKKFLLFALAIVFGLNINAQNLPLFENFNNGLPPGWDLVASSIGNYGRNVGATCVPNQGIIANPSVGSGGSNKTGFQTSALQYVSTGSFVTVRFEGYVYRGQPICQNQLFASTPCSGVARIFIVSVSTGDTLGSSSEIPLNLTTGLNTLVAQVSVNIPINTEFKVLLDVSQLMCDVNGSLRFVIDNVLIAVSGGGPLPVSFKSFKAMRSSLQNVSISWITATEQNNSGFYVQRNTNNKWENIAFVPTRSLNGNSTTDLSYSLTDINNFKGISQYRILQVDINGALKVSEVSIVRGDQNGKISVFPNPSFDGNATILFEDQNSLREVSVFDLTGRIIKQWTNVNNNNLKIDNLKPGFYSIRILNKTTGEQVVEKIIVN